MKNILFLLFAFVGLLVACGGTTNEQTDSNQTAATPAKPAMEPGELLIVKSDCVSCHHKEDKIIGPSYVAIAEKYPVNDQNISLLAGKIINGGKGVWGTIPMTPHSKISEDDAKKMVQYILSFKK